MSRLGLGAVLGGIPVDIDRDAAAAAARDELSKPEYAAHRPSLLAQALQWVGNLIGRLFDAVASVAPGGLFGLVVLVLVVVGIVVLVRWRVGPVRRAAEAEHAVFVGQVRSAGQYRTTAEQAAAAGDWDEAVRQRFRAIVRSLEERDVLDPRPGRTADEAAAEAARLLTGVAAGLAGAARTFDDVAYGGMHAGAEAYRRLCDVDDAIARTAVARVALTGAAAAGWEPLR